jgi:hypothetical protein
MSKTVKSKDVTLSTQLQCGCKFVGDGKRLPTVDSYRKIIRYIFIWHRTVNFRATTPGNCSKI